MTPLTLRQWLQAEPFSLGLSSGFFGFFAHCGMIQVLEQEGLYPQRLAGSSAGALVAACWASGLGADRIAEELLSLQRSDFWDPWPGPGLLRGQKFRERLSALMSVQSFEACRIPLVLSAHDLMSRQTRVIVEGPLIPAVHASCAVPFLFHPVWLGMKPHCDGGVSDRRGIKGIPRQERLLYHHMASQSPWRRANSPSLQLPQRQNTVSLVIADLPRVGPFRLPNGKRALQQAYEATCRALDRPIEKQVVRV